MCFKLTEIAPASARIRSHNILTIFIDFFCQMWDLNTCHQFHRLSPQTLQAAYSNTKRLHKPNIKVILGYSSSSNVR